jgi:vancomycin resistance protein VanJ
MSRDYSLEELAASVAVFLALVLVGHRVVPHRLNPGWLLESFLPWLGIGVGLLGLAALLCRSRLLGLATALPAAVWLTVFGRVLLPQGRNTQVADVRVLTHNLQATNQDVAKAARTLLEAQADLVALQDSSGLIQSGLEAPLGQAYRHRVTFGRHELWSRYPIRDAWLLDLGGSSGLQAIVNTPAGEVAVYAVHITRPYLGRRSLSYQRSRALRTLAGAVHADPAEYLLLLGDLNTASTDRALWPLTRELGSAQAEAGAGFGFTWPAWFPLVRIDHVLYRGMTAVNARVLGYTGSDHRPVVADLRLKDREEPDPS